MAEYTDVVKAPWSYRTDPFKIAGNLYYIGNLHVSSFLLDTHDGLVLLDTGLPQTLYQLMDSIHLLGFDPREVRYIFHTHVHYDHTGGTRAIQEMSGAQTALGRADAVIMTDRPELIGHDYYESPLHGSFAADIKLDGGETFQFGNMEIECLHTPGHTPGTMTYFLTFPYRRRTLRAGLYGGFGTNTLTDDYLRRFQLDDAMRRAYAQSLQTLENRNVDIVLGSHPGQVDLIGKARTVPKAKNPFIAPDQWQPFLDSRKEALKDIWDECFTSGSGGSS